MVHRVNLVPIKLYSLRLLRLFTLILFLIRVILHQLSVTNPLSPPGIFTPPIPSISRTMIPLSHH